MKCNHCGFEWDEQQIVKELYSCPLCGKTIPDWVSDKDIPGSLEQVFKEANQNNKKAQYILGIHFYHGIEVKKNHYRAFQLFEKSAKNGFSEAQFALGVCYSMGHGVTENKKIAEEWYEQSAKQGYSPAMNNYGNLLEEKKPMDGIRYYEAAIKIGNRAALSNWTVVKYNNKKIKFEDAKANLMKASKSFSTAIYNLGILLFTCENKKSLDYESAFEYFEKASLLNHQVACLYSGLRFLYGFECEQDIKVAQIKLKVSVDGGNKHAQQVLKKIKRISKGLSWINDAKKSKEKYLELLSHAYQRGKITSENASQMYQFFNEMLKTNNRINYAAAVELSNYYYRLWGYKKEKEIRCILCIGELMDYLSSLFCPNYISQLLGGITIKDKIIDEMMYDGFPMDSFMYTREGIEWSYNQKAKDCLKDEDNDPVPSTLCPCSSENNINNFENTERS